MVAFALLVSGAATFFVYKMLAAKLTANAAPAQAQVVVATHDPRVVERGTRVIELRDGRAIVDA